MHFQREKELILHLLSGSKNKPPAGSLESLNWEYVARQCEEHSIVPIIYKSLEAADSQAQREKSFEPLRSRYKAIATINFARSAQLIKIVNELKMHELPVIAYKGMALAEYAYRDTTMRQFGDIDIFVRKQDFQRAKQVLLNLGCSPAWDLNESQEAAVLKYYYEYPFYFGDINTLVELHWEFVESFFAFDYEFEEIWERTVPVDLYGTEISTLCAEDYLIVLCSHGSKHFWKRLSWICDVGKLIENTNIDWATVIRRSSRYGCQRMVWIGTYLATVICKTEIPERILRMIEADRSIRRLGDSFVSKLFENEKEPSQWTTMARIHLGMRETLSAKLKYSYRLLTTKAVDSLFLPMGRPR